MKKEDGKYRFLYCFLIKTAIFATVTYVLLACVLKITLVSGNRMSPFVRDGDLGIFSRLENISLGDVVIYENASGQEQIGRVVASGGQTIDFSEQGGYTVNEYQPAEEIPFETYPSDNGYVTYPMELSEGEYFILNDFRNITDDSREQGAIRREQIKGELLFLMRHRGF